MKRYDVPNFCQNSANPSGRAAVETIRAMSSPQCDPPCRFPLLEPQNASEARNDLPLGKPTTTE